MLADVSNIALTGGSQSINIRNCTAGWAAQRQGPTRIRPSCRLNTVRRPRSLNISGDFTNCVNPPRQRWRPVYAVAAVERQSSLNLSITKIFRILATPSPLSLARTPRVLLLLMPHLALRNVQASPGPAAEAQFLHAGRWFAKVTGTPSSDPLGHLSVTANGRVSTTPGAEPVTLRCVGRADFRVVWNTHFRLTAKRLIVPSRISGSRF